MNCAISRAVLDRLRTEARADEEVCGLLLARGGVIDEATPIPNSAIDRRQSFALDPQAHLAASGAARAAGKTIVGHYHSHPSGDPHPSAADAAEASEQGRYWLIVTASEARMWISRSGGSVLNAFEPVRLDPV